MCVQNLKFIAIPVPEIIGGTQKIWGVPGYAHAPFSPKILNGFCSDGLCEYTRQIWDNREYFKNLGSPRIRPRSLYSQIFKGLLFAWTLWIYLPTLKFVALHVPDIIGGTQKNGQSLDTPTFPFLQNFMDLCSDGPCEYIGQICSPYIALAVPEIIVIAVLGWASRVVNPQSWERGGRRGSRMAPFERALVTSYRLSIVTFPLSLRVSEILLLL